MTLYQLGEQYLDEERTIRGRIATLRAELPKQSGGAKRELESRISMLYSMALDTHRIGKYLQNYYNEGDYNVRSTFKS